MHLKRIYLSGFKSFADPVEFEFDPGISAVVGPNGCGKSNIVDAFRWVLGERSAKGLRGTEMLDVIFTGTRTRAALSRAEVRLLFDNQNRTLPVDASEVEIGRILLRDGTSEYQINSKRCRLKDVLAIFADTGIGADGYSVLGQGKVDSFLNSNSLERRKIFEEAAGISSFRKKRSEAEKRLERGEQELTRVTDQLSEIERRIRSLKMQAGRARRYIEDRDRFKMVSSVMSSLQVEELSEEGERVEFRLQWRNTLRELLSDLSGSLETSLDEIRTRLESVHRFLDDTRQKETKMKVSLEGIDARRRQLDEQARHASQRNEDLTRQQQELVTAEQEYLIRREEVRDRLKTTISDLRECRRDLELQNGKYSTIFAEREQLDSRILASKDRDLSLVYEETRLKNTVAALTGDLRGQDTIRDRRVAENRDFRMQQLDLEEQSRLRDDRIIELIELEHNCVLDADRVRDEVKGRLGVLDEARGTLAKLRSDNESNEGRLRFLMELEETLEGLGKGTQKLLNSKEPAARDIRGLLARLIEADPDSARMVDAVLGRVLETVVLQGRTPIESRIRALEKILDGESVSIVSIENEMDGQSREPDPPPGVETLASRIDCETICRPIVDSLLGKVLIASDLNDAILLHRRSPGFCVVIQDGTVIEPWGAVRIPGSSKGGLVSRRVEMMHLRSSMDEIHSRVAEASEQEESLEESISARHGEIQRLDQEAGRARIEADHARREKEKASEELRIVKERRILLDRDMEQALTHYEELSALRDAAHSDLEIVASDRKALNGTLKEDSRRISPLDRQLGDLDTERQRMRLVGTREQERISSDWREQRRLADEVEQRVQLRMRMTIEIEQEEQRQQGFFQQIEDLGQEEVSLLQQLEQISATRHEQDRLLDSCRQERSAVEKRQKECRVQAEKIREGREADRIRANECKVRIEVIRDRVRDEHEVSLDEAPIEQWRTTLLDGIEGDGALVDRLSKEHQQIQARMRRNTNVNLQAVEELETEETRHADISADVADLTRSSDLIRQAIETLDDQCRTRFLSTFEEVRSNFQSIFKLMFGGGVADLVLDPDEDALEAGISVRARPPGKRISSLDLLSGGERALAAISVIFALFKARPSPFCILDEVDAPLDEQNTNRFVKVLQEFALTSQFLIITHSRVTMTEAQCLYGVTMEEEGVSCRVVVKVADASRWVDEKIPQQDGSLSTGNPPGSRELYSDRGSVRNRIAVDDEERHPEAQDHGLQQA